MITIEQFIETHGNAAMRIARQDELFNECLVLPFKSYVEDYNGEWGTVEGYILMRLRYAVLKFQYKEARWMKQFGEPLEGMTEPVEVGVTSTDIKQAETEHTMLHEAFLTLDKEIQLVLELWANGYSKAEIARELALDIRKVRARVAAGITQLREELCCAIQSDADVD